MTQLQAGWCDKMSVRSSPGTGFLVTQLSPRGATKWWGIILIREEVPSKLHQLVLHKSEIAVFK